MIHKPKLILTAMFWAAIITAILLIFPRLREGFLGMIHVPALALAVVIAHYTTGNGHSPSNIIGWSSYAIYTVFYWAFFWIIYAALLEFYLLRKVLHHLDDMKQHVIPIEPKAGQNDVVFDGTDPKKALDQFGVALAELETRRRKHFLLKSSDRLDLTQAPHLLAARAITEAGDARPVKRLMKKLRLKINKEVGSTKSTFIMRKLQDDAKKFAAQPASDKGSDPNPPAQSSPG